MKKKLSILFLLFCSFAKAQSTNKIIIDTLEKKDIMINVCNKDSLLKFDEFKKGYDPNYNYYQPKAKVVATLKELSEGKKITIILGTWCEDSRQYVPFFFKILDEAKIDMKNITLIGVDRNKQADKGLIEHLNIKNVPTFIFFDSKDKEIGRIVEFPKETLEEDMQIILSTKP
ncbi:MAG: thioredoxin family protein [Sphingobacteriaceae bacterium]|nr:thioredoxin family protein [Sphingobacteriaceae bacterium]